MAAHSSYILWGHRVGHDLPTKPPPHTCGYVCVYICVCIYICVCVCVCVCIHLLWPPLLSIFEYSYIEIGMVYEIKNLLVESLIHKNILHISWCINNTLSIILIFKILLFVVVCNHIKCNHYLLFLQAYTICLLKAYYLLLFACLFLNQGLLPSNYWFSLHLQNGTKKYPQCL